MTIERSIMLTTEKLLKMQNAGDVLFDYEYGPLATLQSVESLKEYLPHVDEQLVIAWFEYVQAKEKLKKAIKDAKNSREG